MKISKMAFFAVSTLLILQTSFSQVNIDSLIHNQPPSKSEIINRLRNLLMDAFVENDKEKVRELHLYLTENFDQNNYVTLLPAESILLYAWYNDFDNMFDNILTAKLEESQMQTRIFPTGTSEFYAVSRNFYQITQKQVLKELEEILFNLQTSFLSQEEKDFATIFLHYCLAPRRYYYTSIENYDDIVTQINLYTKKFVSDYPNSQYIKLLIIYEQKPSNWGFGIGVSLGYAAKTGNYYKYFINGVAADLYVDVTFKNIMLTMGVLYSSGGVRNDIAFNEFVLPEGTSADLTNLYLSLGYRFLEGKRFMLTPIAGVGTAWTKPGSNDNRKENPILKQFDQSYYLTLNCGLMTDIRLGKIRKIRGQNFVDPTFYGLRLSYKFSYNTLRDVPIFYDGNLHTITLGIYGFGKSTKYVKYE